MKSTLPILQCGNCEPLKASVHGAVLGLAALCAAYNFAAWLTRHQTHLAINTLLYGILVAWETAHVQHHLAVPPRRRLAIVPRGSLRATDPEVPGQFSPPLTDAERAS